MSRLILSSLIWVEKSYWGDLSLMGSDTSVLQPSVLLCKTPQSGHSLFRYFSRSKKLMPLYHWLRPVHYHPCYTPWLGVLSVEGGACAMCTCILYFIPFLPGGKTKTAKPLSGPFFSAFSFHSYQWYLEEQVKICSLWTALSAVASCQR